MPRPDTLKHATYLSHDYVPTRYCRSSRSLSLEIVWLAPISVALLRYGTKEHACNKEARSMPNILNRVTSRPLFAISTIWLAYFLAELRKFNTHAGSATKPEYVHSRMWTVYVVMTIIFAVQWIISISGRIFDLRLNRLWIIPYLALWAIAVMIMKELTPRQFLMLLGLTILVQFPLMLLRSRRMRDGSPRESGI
jgi:hypothetical protein